MIPRFGDPYAGVGDALTAETPMSSLMERAFFASMTVDDTTRSSEGARPVMGHTRSRFFAHLPANTPVQSHQISPKSLFRNILSDEFIAIVTCTQISLHADENKEF